ncbi:MAG: fatty acid desaturase [Rhodobacterales bacterium]|nr:MAG: fatty acid desaturase [Rhodobacterales bacterium]
MILHNTERPENRLGSPTIEWPTLLVFVATYALWAAATALLWQVSPVLAVLAAALAIAQYSSLTHEVLHGHPFANQRLSEALVFPGFTIFVPYLRFKDLHLQHHFDPNLTDPYDDPESNFQDPAVWARLSAPVKAVLRFNNTLAGRMLLGPAISIWSMMALDLRLLRRGDRRVALAWGLHLPGVAMVFWWLLAVGTMPVWAYLVAAYLGWSLLKIRTYLEHRAHEAARARTVVIESRGPLSLLFLNNNFHVVHHMHPGVAWYKLPALYFSNREHYLRRNDSYLYRSYVEIFREFLFRAKDPVPHPIFPVAKGGALEQAAELRGGAGIVEERHAGLVTARH